MCYGGAGQTQQALAGGIPPLVAGTGSITDDREPAPEVYLVGGWMSEYREKHPTGPKIVSTFF